jgi:hypothetical protein
MKKLYLLGSTLLVVFAFGALAATSAFAVSEWLVEGVAPANGVALNTETEGLFTRVRLVSKTNSAVLNEIDCEAILDGTSENTATGGLGTVTAVLNLLEELINQLSETSPLGVSCTVTFSREETGDCLLNALAELFPDNLYTVGAGPWLTELLALEEPKLGEFLVLDELLGKGVLGEEPGYELRCEAVPFDIIGEELCEGAWEFNLTNEAGAVPSAVLVQTTIGEFKEGECFNLTLGGEETEVTALEGDGNLWAIGVALERLATAIN